MMNRRDFLRSFALTGGLWVLGESAGPIFAAPDKSTSEWPNHPFLQGNFAPVQGETTADNLKVVAPNGKIFGDTIVNYSANPRRRVDVVFHLPPKQNLGAALDMLKGLAAEDDRMLKQPAPIFEAASLNEVYAEGAARVWVEVANFTAVKTKLVLAIQSWSI